MENPISMFTADALRLELYDDWDELPTQQISCGSRDAPIDLEDSSPDVKVEDLWKKECPEFIEVEPAPQLLMPSSAQVAAPSATKPPPDAFERYIKLKMKKLDRKRRQAEEQTAHWARERRDIIQSIDEIPEPDDEDAQLGVELNAWDTRVKQMNAALLAAKAGRKATRLKMDLRQYRREKAKKLLEDLPPVDQIPDSFFVNLLN